MHTAEVVFKRNERGRHSPEQHEEAIWGVLAEMGRNGQLIDRDLSIVITRGGYKAVVGLPERTSLRTSLFSERVRKELSGLKMAGLQLVKVSVIGRDLESQPVCKCRKRSALILETSYLSTEVPLCCGDCCGTIPLYQIPHTTEHGTYEDIRGWVDRYRALNTLWFGSGVGEQFAYRQLSRHDSGLSSTGRSICRRIEKLTGIPAYYYLSRWYARSVAAERRRPCPNCHGKWLLQEPWHRVYDFRCDRCRLVSNIGLDVR
jgi:predicted  nucleic acid-binding Zn ribbon protein